MGSIPLIEEACFPDVFVTAIGRIERLTSGLVRITYYTERRNDAGDMEHVVALKMIRPIETWPQAARMMARIVTEIDMPFILDGTTVLIKSMN